MKLIFYPLILLTAILLTLDLYAEKKEEAKDILNKSKLTELKREKERLSNQIKVEDAKRNKQVPGVAYETLENMNDCQDSICLTLRSQLVDINLEIKQLTPTIISPGLINQYNNLINQAKKDTTDL